MESIFSYIKSNIDIVDVIGDYVHLSRAGNYYKGISPFKHEKTASFTVTPEKKIFYCFSSNIGGDVIEFVAKMENCSSYQAAQFIIQKYHLPIPPSIMQQNKNNEEEIIYFKIYECFSSWCSEMLYKNQQALEYLYRRGISKQSIDKFQIGYCPDFHMLDNFFQYALKKGILIKDIKNTDILFSKNNKLYFSAYHRIIFPIKNYLNLYCGYGARIFLEHDSRSKYINTNNGTYFSKKNIIFGFDHAKEAIKKQNTVFLVEGYLDAIMMHQAGYPNTVATMGTACTKHHLEHISKFTKNINLVYDGDEAGQDAMQKIIEMSWAMCLDTHIILLPKNTDPAELAKENKLSEALIHKENAIPFFIKNKHINIDHSSLSSIHKGLSEILTIIDSIEDSVIKTAFILQVSKHCSINQEILFNIIKKKTTSTVSTSINNVIKSDHHANTQNKKHIWYLFFYFILLHWDTCHNKDIKKIIFLYLECGIYELGTILKIYSTKNNQDSLTFLREQNQALYQLSLKIYTTYDFQAGQFNLFYKKFISIAMQEYKKKYPNKTLSEFQSMLKKIELL